MKPCISQLGQRSKLTSRTSRVARGHFQSCDHPHQMTLSKLLNIAKMPKCSEVVIARHSFVRGLQRLCTDDQEWTNLGLDADKHLVKFHGSDGGSHVIAVVQQLVEDVNTILKGRRNLDFVIIDIGSNDFNKDSGYTASHLVQVISDLTEALLGRGVRWVVVAEMFFHKGAAARCWNAPETQEVKLAESLCLQHTHQFNNS